MINFENLDKFTFPGVGKYGIPQIEPVKSYPTGEFIPVNYHYTAKDQASKIVHFFVDDYQFFRYWNSPGKYIPKLLQFAAVCAPVGGIVAVSSVGTQQNKESKRLFLRGYEEMMKRLSPEWVIFYGKVPEECDWNVIRVKPHYDDIVKRRKANEISVSAGNP